MSGCRLQTTSLNPGAQYTATIACMPVPIYTNCKVNIKVATFVLTFNRGTTATGNLRFLIFLDKKLIECVPVPDGTPATQTQSIAFTIHDFDCHQTLLVVVESSNTADNGAKIPITLDSLGLTYCAEACCSHEKRKSKC